MKRLLEAEGAIVFISWTGFGKGAIEEDFFMWKEKHPDLQAESLSKLFRVYYNKEDLRKRAKKINDFSPDITLIIHYNPHLNGTQKEANPFFTRFGFA